MWPEGEGATPFPGLLHFTLDTYLILLRVKQGGIKYHFLSLWYDVTWDWTHVSRTIGEHSTHLANELKRRNKRLFLLDREYLIPYNREQIVCIKKDYLNL